MNLVRSEDKRYLNPWFPFFNLFEDDDISTSRISGMNMSEDEQSVHVELAVPGMSEKDLDVQIENGVLTVRGAKSEEDKSDSKGRKVYFSSIKSSFYYSATLPSTAGNEADASLNNGILSLKIAKREDSKPRKIEIKKG